MGSDRARVSYDPNQQYRSVVMQQGRVTLEADWNEAQQIASEELRNETLDIVGPAGTPDDGYKVVLYGQPTHPPYDFYIRSGTMYVGGLRAELLVPVQYSSQPDWLDHSTDPDWVSLSSLAQHPPTDEFIYLLLREQEVSAVEDPDLKDVALGGPDTAQRTRLLQRFVRLATDGKTCVAGLASAVAKWQSEGLWFDSTTMRLTSGSTLQVSYSGQAQTDPCQPIAQGGYVAPDNQLIRVQISGIDPLTGNPKFLWGFDDASFLYRIDVDPNNSQNLIFESAPVDSEHQPVSGQAIEVLRSAAELSNGGYVASLSGFVATLTQNYAPDTQSVTLPPGVFLPAEYLNATQSPPTPLFLRVWQQEIVFTPGKPAALGTTGVQVTLQPPAGLSFHTGDYWMFAVRPATPQAVYPERYNQSPQPPEGPRLWACPLGVIAWSDEIGTLVADCRNPFDNLIDLYKRQEGCCTITVRPQDLTKTTLQAIIDQAASPTMFVQATNAGAPGNNISVQVTNLQLDSTPPTFDLIVSEVDQYLGIAVSGFNGIDGIIGDNQGGPNTGLAHILNRNTINAKLMPLDNQTVHFTGGQGQLKAQANILDGTNHQLVFTLEARGAGVDGNTTTASISNVSGTTFDLTVTWQRRVSGINMATLFAAIKDNFNYLIAAKPLGAMSSVFPADGITRLSGGADANLASQTGAVPAHAAVFGNPATICLRPGSYLIPKPLTLGLEHSNIAIEACGSATITAGKFASEKDFAQGLMHINGANGVTLDGLTFDMPRMSLYSAGLNLAGLDRASVSNLGDAALVSLDTSVGLMVTGVNGLTVKNCVFRFPNLLLDEFLFGVAIFAGSDCSAVTLTGNMFNGPASLQAVIVNNAVPAVALAAGYLQADSLQSLTIGANGSVTGGSLVASTLDNIICSGNSFQNLAFPIFILTAVGAATFERNVMRSCLSGITILPLTASVAAINQVNAGDFRTQAFQNPVSQRLISIAVAYPRTSTVLSNVNTLQFASAAPKEVLSAATSRIVLTNLAAVAAPVVTAAPVAAPVAPTAPVTVPTAPVTPPTAPPVSTAPVTAPTAPPVSTAPVTPAPPIVVTPPILKLQTLSPLTLRVAEYISNIPPASVITTKAQKLQFRLFLSNNDIDAVVPGTSGVWAVSILDYAALLKAFGGSPGPNAETTFGSLTMTGNKLLNSSTGALTATAFVMVDFCAVAGNVILNQIVDGGSSLVIAVFDTKNNNISQAAITGNVFRGETTLPPRTPASLPPWTSYNFAI